ERDAEAGEGRRGLERLTHAKVDAGVTARDHNQTREGEHATPVHDLPPPVVRGRLTPPLSCGRHSSGKILHCTDARQRTEPDVVCPSAAAPRYAAGALISIAARSTTTGAPGAGSGEKK